MFGIFKGNIIHAHHVVKYSKNSYTSHGSWTRLLPPCPRLSPRAWTRPQHHAHSPGRSGDRNLFPLVALPWPLTINSWHGYISTDDLGIGHGHTLSSILSPAMLMTHPEPVFLHLVSSQPLKTPSQGTNRTWNFPQPRGSQSLISVRQPAGEVLKFEPLI